MTTYLVFLTFTIKPASLLAINKAYTLIHRLCKTLNIQGGSNLTGTICV
jgi:hypothetical protein